MSRNHSLLFQSISTFALSILLAGSVHAQTKAWIIDVNSDQWSTDENWTGVLSPCKVLDSSLHDVLIGGEFLQPIGQAKKEHHQAGFFGERPAPADGL